MPKNVTRLAGQFLPTHYDLSIKLADDGLSFQGSLVLSGKKVGRPSSRITLHQKNLKIHAASLQHIDKKGATHQLPITRTVTQKSSDELRLHTDVQVVPGIYQIHLEFSGKITKNMDGIYPCYFEEDRTKKFLIATQFESHHAREVFPCIDEPEAKATFSLTLTHQNELTALSNTAIATTKVGATHTATTFEKTPIMSTYLLAFVVGELSYKETFSKSGVRIRTYATKEQVAHTSFALDVAQKAMDFYEDYYDQPFPLTKCDFVALPEFASGAMENWGLITFREQTMLCDETTTSLSTKQYVAIVVAHELTHQWFGNLVTMRWWTDLWLNEGFASWMEYLAIDEMFPEWQLWTQFIVDEIQYAMKLDALEHTHPIEVPIHHPDEIRTIFDAISYQKGASMIHMLYTYLGAEDFRDGLRHYLATYAYRNTDTVDLWASLEHVSKKPVRAFMHTWTSEPGFPLVSVEKKDNHFVLSQQRFITNPLNKDLPSSIAWPVPLLTEGVDKEVTTHALENIPLLGDTPLKLNMGQTGFYRVRYSKELVAAQVAALQTDTFSATDRMGLLSDSFEVTKAGMQSVTTYLDLLQGYKKEDSLSTWEIIAGSLGSIRTTLSKSDTDERLRDAMKPYVQQLTAHQLKRLGWAPIPDEPHLDTLLRPLIIGVAAGADTPEVISTLLTYYAERRKDPNYRIDPDLRGTVLTTKARYGDQATFDELLEDYKTTQSSDEKMSICAALTNFSQPEIIAQALTLITDDSVRLQDKAYWIAYLFMNRHAKRATWEWLQSHWEWLRDTLGTDLAFSRMPLYAARTFADETSLNEYTTFFSRVMEPMLERTYQQGVEIIETATAWRTRDADAAQAWFESRS